MTADGRDTAELNAIMWHIRLREGDDDTWAQFIDWLAEDPHNGEVYGRVETADRDLDTMIPDLVFREAANDVSSQDLGEKAVWWRVSAGKRAIAGGLLAASVAAAVLIGQPFSSTRYDVATGPGEQRQITLGDDTVIDLNGSTRITLDHRNDRFAALNSGQALLHVHHDAARPFTLSVGDRQVVDLGTVFDVVRDTNGVRLAVAEGKIAYRTVGAGSQNLIVTAGQALTDAADADTIRVTAAPAAVGGWRDGHFVYAGTPLSEVAEDIGRTLGLRITVAPTIARRPVSGSVALAGHDAAEAKRLGAVLDVTIDTRRDGWTMQPIGNARP